MTTQSIIAQQIWEEMREAQQSYKMATNTREQAFSTVRKISSSVYGILKACRADPLLLADALNRKRRIWGSPISKLPAIETEKAKEEMPTSRPSYGRGYVNVAEYFDRLVKIVASEAKYSANEQAFTVAGLQQMAADLFRLNKAVVDAEIKLEEARIKCNVVYYSGPNNLVETASSVRTYVRSVFGFRSQEHQQVQKLRFTKINL